MACVKAAGILINIFLSVPPASNNKIFNLMFLESLFAKTQPADPAPIII